MVDDSSEKRLVLSFEPVTGKGTTRARRRFPAPARILHWPVEFRHFESSYTQKARKYAGDEHDIPTHHRAGPEIHHRSRHFRSGNGPGELGLLPAERRDLVRSTRSRPGSFLGRSGRL